MNGFDASQAELNDYREHAVDYIYKVVVAKEDQQLVFETPGTLSYDDEIYVQKLRVTIPDDIDVFEINKEEDCRVFSRDLAKSLPFNKLSTDSILQIASLVYRQVNN